MTPRELHEQISELAYLMWEAAGRQQGLAVEYWLAAERQVMAMVGTAVDQFMTPRLVPFQPRQSEAIQSKAVQPADPQPDAATPEPVVKHEAEPEPIVAELADDSTAEAVPEAITGGTPDGAVAVAPESESLTAAASETATELPAEPAAPSAPESSPEPTVQTAAGDEPAPVAPAQAEPAAEAEPQAESLPSLTEAEPAKAIAEAAAAPASKPVAAPVNLGVVEHKTRPIVRKDWIGRNVTLDLATASGHFVVPHDALWNYVKAHKTVATTKTWQEKGEYSWPKIPGDLLEFLSSYSRD